MTSLKDKVVLITGAGDVKGIGAATALHMIQFGAKLVITGRDSTRLNLVGQKLLENGILKNRLLMVTCDVTVDADVERLVKDAVDRFGRLDVLVNNAAVVAYHDTIETSLEEFDYVMKTNIRSPFLLTKLCLPYLIKTKGCVVNVSSICGQQAYTGEISYCISKAALDQFTNILAMEMARYGVRVNSVNPGVIHTDIQMKGGMSKEQYERYKVEQKLTHPLGYVGNPIDVAKAITFLASDEASFTTGQMLFVDGGRNKKPLDYGDIKRVIREAKL